MPWTSQLDQRAGSAPGGTLTTVPQSSKYDSDRPAWKPKAAKAKHVVSRDGKARFFGVARFVTVVTNAKTSETVFKYLNQS